MKSLKNNLKRNTLFFVLIFSMMACSPARPPVPIGTIPKATAPTTTEEQIGHNMLAELTKKYELDYDHPRYQNVQTVVRKLTEAAGAKSHPWHVYLLKDPKFKNAGATRGNHIFLWTAMLDYTNSDAELAGVLAHEMGHILARHTDPDANESIRRLLISLGGMAAGIAAARVTGSAQVGQTAGRVATQVTNKVGEGLFLNPWSRTKEYEADQVGLFLMAKAGYDPKTAIEFWKRASREGAFGSGPSFLSTHPSSADRQSRLEQMLPRAEAVYRGEPFQTPLDPARAERYPSTSKPTRARPASRAKPSNKAPEDDSWDVRQ